MSPGQGSAAGVSMVEKREWGRFGGREAGGRAGGEEVIIAAKWNRLAG